MGTNLSDFDDNSESILNLFDLKSPDITLLNSVDSEVIKLSGSKIFYYKYQPTNEYDEVYHEDRNKVISKEPIIVFGHYDAKVIEETVGKFGLELNNDQDFTFNKDYITRKLGRMPIAGDIVKPQFQNIRFKIFEVQLDGFEAYGIYHTVCSAKILRDAPEVSEQNLPNVSKQIGNIDIDE